MCIKYLHFQSKVQLDHPVQEAIDERGIKRTLVIERPLFPEERRQVNRARKAKRSSWSQSVSSSANSSPSSTLSSNSSSTSSFWKRVFHKIERTVQTPNRHVVLATSSSSAIPSRPQNHIDICGEEKNDEIEDCGWPNNNQRSPKNTQESPNNNQGSPNNSQGSSRNTQGSSNNNRGSLSEESELLSEEEALLAAAFGDFVLDECAPRAIIEEMEKLELELGM